MKLKSKEKVKKKPKSFSCAWLDGAFCINAKIPAVMAVFCNSFLTVQVITFNSRSISAAVSKSIETSHQEKEKKT